jgi:chitodextrinase
MWRKTNEHGAPLLAAATPLRILRLIAALCGICLAAPAQATELPPGFSEVELPRPDGSPVWNEAVGMTFSEEGRMFVWERGGKVWILDQDNPVAQPMLDISDEVLAWRDHGMLGFALDPGFEVNGYVYVLYVVDPYHLQQCDSPAVGVPQCSAPYDANQTWIPGDPGTPGFNKATIGRLARYQAIKPAGDTNYEHATQVDYSTRRVLIGETLRSQPKSTGIPILFESHGVGSLVFGKDGTLLVSAGDGASFFGPDVGSAEETWYLNALADGIISTKENVGALRAQLVDSLSGKILRVDPVTGNGIASNPFYDASAPRAARSRVWARGLRNPYRITLRPDTGSHVPADGDPGVLYFGDVGYNTWEEVDVAITPGRNYGWPLYEGLEAHSSYQSAAANVANRDAPNPLFGPGCTLQFFRFVDLIKQDTLNPTVFTNPCGGVQPIPASARASLHSRPVLDMHHETANTRWAAYASNGTALALPLNTAAFDGTVVTGTNDFIASSTSGGNWFEGTGFPAPYDSRYFVADYGAAWIKIFDFDANHRLHSISPFATDPGGVVTLASNHHHEGLYYIAWTAFVRHVTYAAPGGSPPVAVAAGTPLYGPSPLSVNFSSAGSFDPDGGALTYAWDFGDGGTSTLANPSHVYTVPGSTPTNRDATLVVRDPQGKESFATLLVSVNNTPPSAVITSPVDGSLYSITGGPVSVNLRATISDTNTPATSLQCQWQQVLYHNLHEHSDPFVNTCDATGTITPIGCDGQNYSYGFRLWVTDAQGLTTAREVKSYPDCATPSDSVPPSVPLGLVATQIGTNQISLAWNASSDAGTGVAGYRVLRNGVQVGSVTSTTFTDSGLAASTSYSYTVTAFDAAVPANVSAPSTAVNATTLAPSSTAIRVNTGGPAFTDNLGQLWAADTGFNTGFTYSVGNPIAGTVNDVLYQSERYDDVVAPELQYSFVVANGTYDVRLHFSENYQVAANQRVFDVNIEGVRRFEDIDVFAQAGGAFTALVRTATVAVNDGQLNIQFLHQTENPLIDAIEIVGAGAPADTTPPSVPTGLTATAQSGTQIALAWTASTDAGSGIGGYRVFRGATLITTVTTTSYTDTGLTPATLYSYTIVAFDHASPANVSAASTPASATTQGTADTTPPTVPTGLTATAQGSTQIALAWSASTDAGLGVAGYRINRGGVQVATATTNSYTDTGLTPNTLYTYSVASFDNASPANVSANSSPANATTLAGTGTVIRVNTGGPAFTDNLGQVWAADNGFNTGLTYTVTNPIAGTVNDVLYQSERYDDAVAPELQYSFTVPNGNYDVRLHFSENYQTAANLRVFDVNIEGVRRFEDIDVFAQAGGAYTALVRNLTVTVSDGQLNIQFLHQTENPLIEAIEVIGVVSDTTAPTVPTGLTATAQSSTQIALAWNPSTDAGTGVAGYRVYRGATLVTTVTTTSYTDSALTPSTLYSYTIVAFDAASPANVSPASTPASATTQAAPDTTAPTVPTGLTATAQSSTQIALAWTASTDAGTGVAGYRVFRGATLVTTVTTTSYIDSGLTPATLYSYTIVAFDGATPANVSAASASASATTQTAPDTTAPTVPTGLTATAQNSTQIALAWNASTDTGGTGVAGYRVFRGATLVTTVTTTSYTDNALTPSTLYSYTIVAFDGATPANVSAASAPASATTQAAPDTTAPTVPTGLTATAQSSTQIALAWNASTDAGAGVAGYRVFRGATLVTTVTTTSYTDSALTPETLYSYTIVAFDAATPANVSAESAPASATTLAPPPDTTAPTVPTGLSATAQSPTQIALAWNASTDSGGTGVAGYRVYRGATLVTTVTATSYTDTGLTPSTLYSYTIVAFDAATPANVSAASAPASATTLAAPDTTAPTVPTGLTATAQSSTQIALAWNASTDAGTGVAGYRVFRDATLVTTVTTTSYTDGGLTANTAYSYTVVAFDGATPANVSAATAPVVETTQPAPPDTTPPTTPTGLSATAQSATQIALTWTASTDAGLGVAGYRVFRGATLAATVTATSFTDSALTPATLYSYTVVAFDAAIPANDSAPSAPASATTLAAPDTTAPTVPTGLTATAQSSTQIALAWNASTDTGGTGVAGYRVFRGATLVTTVTTTSYTDSGLTPSTLYSYTIVAFDAATPANVSAASAPASATTQAAPDTTAPTVPTGLTATAQSSTQIALAWNASTDAGTGVAGYRVFRGATLITTVTTTSYTDTGLTAATLYSYTVVAFDAATPANVSAASAPASATTQAAPDTTAPTVPTGLTATAQSSTQIALAWNASTDAGTGVAGYRVFRGATLVTTVTTTSYTDSGLIPSTLYSYTVRAIDNAVPVNVSAASASASATTLASSGTVIRVNPGGPAFTDNLGQIWSADTGFNTGLTYSVANPIAATVNDVLYQSERYDDAAAPELQYSFTVPNGSYEVRLHFSENYQTAANLRVFDVNIEGVRRFEDSDIFAQAGGAFTALVRNVTVTVTDGQLNIQFLHQTENPLIDAIEIIGTGAVSDTTPPTVPTGLTATPQSATQVALAWNISTDAGTGVAGYRVLRGGVQVGTATSNSYTDTGLTPNTLYTYSVAAFDNASPANVSANSSSVNATTPAVALTTIRVNTGGAAFTDNLGQVWAADTGFNTGVTYSVANPIAGTVNDVLYQSERYDDTPAPELQYSFSVPNGNYDVRLHFSENYQTAANLRVFDVNIEGVRRFEDIDIFAQAGAAFTALVRNVTVTVTDGQLNIQFLHQTQNPLVQAIEIIGQ